MSQRHKTFVSFNHGDETDPNRGEVWKDRFVEMMTEYSQGMVDKSVWDGDIDTNLSTDEIRRRIREDYLADSTVTVVLIGPCTWARKHVDWEISATLRDTQHNPRSGLLGILLPTHSDYNTGYFNPNLIPRRLVENVGSDIDFAKVYDWSDDPNQVQDWIHIAFERRNQEPSPTYPTKDLFKNNRPCDQDDPQGWQ
ncbi:MAG: TIR domain-containing protein [Bacteroidota bacterium]